MIPVEFILESKKSAYAGDAKPSPKRDGSKEIVICSGCYSYIDNWFGSNPFIGSERVFRNGNFIWGMNYFGRCVDDLVPSNKIYEFLKQALLQANSAMPFRGPARFELEDFLYRNEVKGTISNFIGTESISYKGRVVYSGEYHGGALNC